MEKEMIKVEIDGVVRDAEVLNMVTVDDKRYVFYHVDLGNGTSDVYASEVVKDAEGYDTLVDIEDEEIRRNVFEVAHLMLEEEN